MLLYSRFAQFFLAVSPLYLFYHITSYFLARIFFRTFIGKLDFHLRYISSLITVIEADKNVSFLHLRYLYFYQWKKVLFSLSLSLSSLYWFKVFCQYHFMTSSMLNLLVNFPLSKSFHFLYHFSLSLDLNIIYSSLLLFSLFFPITPYQSTCL